ncbi:LysR family transcriptional regulator [Gluconobacter sp. Dm-62]|uniref:LysR family transcriptional regulator n=1 Tax=Gluconobacter sp. Dm-62 TaxID=2799804 RepID=UPI001B8BBB69|nr:LysR family transcriptional regulator [Gluconobacter sp. Dm-62]MBS1101649.1 LysR family transcriptional regulator [Gluconobacter sp. Dm-62]
MSFELDDLSAFVAVARAGGFREAARISGSSASGLSDALRRLETRLGTRLLHRSTRSISLTETGARLFERLSPALAEISAALDTLHTQTDQPAGTIRLNVPANVARTVLPGILSPFLKAYPQIRVEVTVEDSFVDILASGADAGIRYEERLEQDMIAVPIGPRTQRLLTAAAPSYLSAKERPQHPSELLEHSCLRLRFSSGAPAMWEFEKNGEIIRLDPPGPLMVQPGSACDLLVEAAIAGLGIVCLFEDWLAPHIRSGALEVLLEDWAAPFSGPMLYYSGRRQLPPPLRAFVDFIRVHDFES